MRVPTNVLTTWKVPRETQEWLGPVTVTVGGTPVTNFKLCLLPEGTRPPTDPASATWLNPAMSGPDAGLSMSGLSVGTYHLWALYSTGLEPGIVVEAGLVVVT